MPRPIYVSGECPASLRGWSVVLPQAEPGPARSRGRRRGCGRLCQCFLLGGSQCKSWELLEVGQESHGGYEDLVVSRHQPRPEHRAWAVRFPMAQASLRRPSRQTLHQGVLCLWSHSVSTDVLVLLPCKEIRKVILPEFGILASLAWPEATQMACGGHPHKAQVRGVFLLVAGHHGVGAGAELEGWPHLGVSPVVSSSRRRPYQPLTRDSLSSGRISQGVEARRGWDSSRRLLCQLLSRPALFREPLLGAHR